jgi:acetyl esterase/lipase
VANYLAVVLRWLLLLVALFLALAGLFTTFLAPGWIDELLAAKLTAAGRPNTLVSVPWASHAFDTINFDGPGAQITTYSIAWFLAAVTR